MAVKFVKTLSAKLNDITQRVIKVNVMGKSDTQTAIQASPYGIDSNPVKDMVAIYAESTVLGDPVIIGYLNKDQISEVGEHRIYSTDANGVLKTDIHLKNDGTIEIGGNSNFMVKFNELQTAFNILKADLDTVRAVHSLPPSLANIAPAKINNIKTS